MRILIVDDEPRHLRGMVNLILQLRPAAQVTAMKDGAAALEYARSEHPDVILTDIQMPKLDGLAFLRQLNEEGMKSKVVMVSAYNLFEYAQSAVRHGACDYLLKPIEPERVEELLNRLEHQLETESAQHSAAEELKHRYKLASSAYQNRLFLTWLNGSMTPLEREELITHEWLQGSGLIIYSELRMNNINHDNYDNAFYIQCLEEAWSGIGKTAVLPLNSLLEDGDQAVAIITIPPLSPVVKNQLRASIVSLAAEWANEGELAHGIGFYCECLMEEGPQAYRAAQLANRHNFYEGWQGGVFHDDLLPSHHALLLDGEKLFEALQEAQADAAVDMCMDAFGRVADRGQAPPSLIKDNASLTLLKIKSRIRDIVDKRVGNELTHTATVRIQSCRSYKELMELLRANLLEVHEALRESQRDTGEIVVAKCLHWIQEHLKEDVTLEWAAEHFFFNPSYFSTLIKTRTGRTFSEHLTEVRMKRARELLAENKLRIYEISAECGYQDTKYFCRVFKKQYGMSPVTYKHISLSERESAE